jgi:hypothetical protein
MIKELTNAMSYIAIGAVIALTMLHFLTLLR